MAGTPRVTRILVHKVLLAESKFFKVDANSRQSLATSANSASRPRWHWEGRRLCRLRGCNSGNVAARPRGPLGFMIHHYGPKWHKSEDGDVGSRCCNCRHCSFIFLVGAQMWWRARWALVSLSFSLSLHSILTEEGVKKRGARSGPGVLVLGSWVSSSCQGDGGVWSRTGRGWRWGWWARHWGSLGSGRGWRQASLLGTTSSFTSSLPMSRYAPPGWFCIRWWFVWYEFRVTFDLAWEESNR